MESSKDFMKYFNFQNNIYILFGIKNKTEACNMTAEV